jgi:hypothetical protein
MTAYQRGGAPGSLSGKLYGMTVMTTMKVTKDVRDRLAKLARRHDRSLGAELTAMVALAEEREWWQGAGEAVARLQADGEQWAEYLAEADEWDALASDGLPHPTEEWPEFNPVAGS